MRSPFFQRSRWLRTREPYAHNFCAKRASVCGHSSAQVGLCFRPALWLGCLWAAFFCGSGCTAVQAPRQHVVLVSRSGKSMWPDRARKPEKSGEFAEHLAVITNAIANCANCAGGDGTKRILIFVHGGMNTFNQSLERVQELVPAISNASYYPLFIN